MTLDHAFLAIVGKKAEGYIIYADLCTLSESELNDITLTSKKSREILQSCKGA